MHLTWTFQTFRVHHVVSLAAPRFHVTEELFTCQRVQSLSESQSQQEVREATRNTRVFVTERMRADGNARLHAEPDGLPLSSYSHTPSEASLQSDIRKWTERALLLELCHSKMSILQ